MTLRPGYQNMQRKILVMGLPGAGKTALATALAPLLNAVVFNADAVRANLAHFGTAVSLTMSDHAPPVVLLSGRPASRPSRTASAFYKLREDKLVPVICP